MEFPDQRDAAHDETHELRLVVDTRFLVDGSLMDARGVVRDAQVVRRLPHVVAPKQELSHLGFSRSQAQALSQGAARHGQGFVGCGHDGDGRCPIKLVEQLRPSSRNMQR